MPPRPAWRAALRGLPIDADAGAIDAAGERRRLSPQEEIALGCLLLREVATHDALVVALWGAWLDPPETFLAGVRVVIWRLRQKLDGVAVISTLIGRGYRLEVAANDNHAGRGDPASPQDRPGGGRPLRLDQGNPA
jgi:DNA-binding response OmpR family regulator